jgi:2-phospho-L-lactate transferase CofD
VLFSGGRGSGALTRQLVCRPGVSLTVAINGYDDGASTGEVRRFLGDSLGPSDFRKNASRFAAELKSCSPDLIALLDSRLPPEITASAAVEHLTKVTSGTLHDRRLVDWMHAFLYEYSRRATAFAFADCSIGNLVFAGAYLRAKRDFNRAVDEYCALLGIPAGLIENVTDGTNAHLVALDAGGRLLRTEEAIVDARAQNTIKTLFLIDRPLSDEEARQLEAAGPEAVARALEGRRATVTLNPRLADRIRTADVIVYAPGTQHSSLFPSYMTPGLGDAIAANLRAIKLLVTNIQTDAEITGSTAVDLIDRALHYLNLKGERTLPTPCLITHYLMNEPGRTEASPYVPLGPVDTIEDPRLVRIGNYEEGVTGRHDAARILGPFVDALQAPTRPYRMAVLLHDAGSLNKVTQTLLEMIRGGIEAIPLQVTMFYEGRDTLDPTFAARLPFAVRNVADARAFAEAVRAGEFDYVGLFESSGMYRGEDLVGLASQLTVGRLDAVWGSRRLSVRDIHESYRLRYKSNVALGAVSYVGSHVLSLAYLLLYGRYISDTLSAVRAVRATDALEAGIELTHKRANQFLLSRLLRRRAEILELPVQFFPISPDKVKRTSPFDGIQSLATIVARRFAAIATPAAVEQDKRSPDHAGDPAMVRSRE